MSDQVLNLSYETRDGSVSMRTTTDLNLDTCEDWELQEELNWILKHNEDEQVISINGIEDGDYNELFPNTIWEVPDYE
ncbi:MAG: hypothetical protein CM15mV29_0600 [uncultured marine virus]|jgi:hypothetical protein|nr:MAG: hypothetical protein CM15mV29_0600 [uncultured marine virus]